MATTRNSESNKSNDKANREHSMTQHETKQTISSSNDEIELIRDFLDSVCDWADETYEASVIKIEMVSNISDTSDIEMRCTLDTVPEQMMISVLTSGAWVAETVGGEYIEDGMFV